MEEGGRDAHGERGRSGGAGGAKHVLYLDNNGSYPHIHIFVKIHQIVHVRLANFILCKVYFSTIKLTKIKTKTRIPCLFFPAPSEAFLFPASVPYDCWNSHSLSHPQLADPAYLGERSALWSTQSMTNPLRWLCSCNGKWPLPCIYFSIYSVIIIAFLNVFIKNIFFECAFDFVFWFWVCVYVCVSM